jgi:hypothetical protein
MKFISKILSIMLITTILLTLMTDTVVAETSSTDINTMSTALNKLNILQGSNGDYLLNNKIKRSEAAALIIRMLGKENFVQQNAEQLKSTKYTDVPSKEWYAPYVGYCTQYNIMGGYTDGSFAPNDYVSEKAFIKMVLCAIGYVYNTDFDWSNVYQKAFSAGVVTDQAYSSQTQDNSNYLRSGAVKLIFNSLNALKKGTTTKMIFVLVDEGAFTHDVVTASGILGADKLSEIDQITATGYDSIEINLNEDIQSVNTADITIIETTAATTSAVTTSAVTTSAVTTAALTVKSAACSNDKIQIITSGQTPGKSYTITIKSVRDTEGNISGQLTGTFTGYVRQQVTSDFFKISKIVQEAANVINVYFTQPLNSNCESAAYYELQKNGDTYVAASSQNITAKKLESEDNAVSIYLNNVKLTQGEEFSLNVSGKLTSSYGVKLGEGSGETIEFVTTSADTGELTVSSVKALTSTTVRVIFSNDVNTKWAEKYLNYSVYDENDKEIAVTNAVKTGTGSKSGRTVVLSLASSLDDDEDYELKMEYIPDIYNQSFIEEETFSFSGDYSSESTKLEISSADSDYNNCVVLQFNKALDESTATDTNNYTIKGVSDSSFNTAPAKAYYDDTYGDYLVKLYLPEDKTFSSSKEYKVYVTGLKDSAGTKSSLLSEEFDGSSYSAVDPQIADAVTVSKDAVKLAFTLEIAFDMNNISTANYTLEYTDDGETIKMQPIGVTYVDAKTLILRFDELDASKTYTIRFDSINDYSGVYTRTSTEGGNTATVRWGN